MIDFDKAGGLVPAVSRVEGAERVVQMFLGFTTRVQEFATRMVDVNGEPGAITSAETLSLWTGIDAVRRFAYGGLHKAALGKRAEWFVKPLNPKIPMRIGSMPAAAPSAFTRSSIAARYDAYCSSAGRFAAVAR